MNTEDIKMNVDKEALQLSIKSKEKAIKSNKLVKK